MAPLLLFSDLHLNKKTEKTCFDVLRCVHKHALESGATVGFLGDFFDHVYRRGTVPVDTLNRLIRFFHSEWRVDMIMIPGNHDYFDASETEHALTPFKCVNPKIRVVDTPTTIDGALWVPWRRDRDTLLACFGSETPLAVFGHFDVVGAYMSNTQKSEEGLKLEDFPQCPVYTGHYHKAQLHGDRVMYVGSPYQTTQSEVGQAKRLVLLRDFVNTTDIIIDYGPKRYDVNTLADIDTSSLATDDVVTLRIGSKDAVPEEVKALRAKGVVCKIKRTIETRPVRFETSVDTTPMELLRAYAAGKDDPEVLAFVEEWLKTNMTGESAGTSGVLEWHRLGGEGIGPFKKPFHIDLTKRGLLLVTGTRDNDDARSNGAGKSMVTAGTFLWVLTGMTDARVGTERSGISSAVNVSVGKAKATLTGTLGGKHFKVERQYALPKKDKGSGRHYLKVFLDYKDVSRSTLDGTQRLIATMMGMPSDTAKKSAASLHKWLLRTTLWTQSVPVSWLEMTDSHVKEEIGWLSDVELWKSLETHIKNTMQEMKGVYVRAEAAASHARLDANTLRTQIDRMRATNAAWMKKKEENMAKWESRLAALPELAPPTPISVENVSPPTPFCVSPTTAKTRKARMEELWTLRSQRKQLQGIATSVPEGTALPKVEVVDVASARQEYSDAKAWAIKPTTHCEACNRPFGSDEERAEAEKKYRAAKRRVDKAKAELNERELAYARMQTNMELEKRVRAALDARAQLGQVDVAIAKLEIAVAADEESERLARRASDEARREYERLRHEADTARSTFAAAMRAYEERQKMRADLKKDIDNLRNEVSPYQREIDMAQAKVTIAEQKAADATAELTDLRKRGEVLKRARTWAGSKGIATYVMDNVLRKIESRMATWCERMFPFEDVCIRLDHNEKGELVRDIQVGGIKQSLSGGQYRRLQIAAWYAWRDAAIDRSGVDPTVVIMDEPTHSMDAQGVEALNAGVRHWTKEDARRTAMMITHESGQFRDSSAYDDALMVARDGTESRLLKRRKCC